MFIYEDLSDIEGNVLGCSRLLSYKQGETTLVVTTQLIDQPRHFYSDPCLVYCHDKIYLIGGLMVNNYTSFEAFDFKTMAWE